MLDDKLRSCEESLLIFITYMIEQWRQSSNKIFEMSEMNLLKNYYKTVIKTELVGKNT